MLQAKTEEQKNYVRSIIVNECPCGNSVLRVFDDWLEADIAELTFDNMAKIVDYLRSANQPQKETLDLSIVAPEMREVVETWLAYKREKKQTYKPTGFKTFYKNLCAYSNNNPKIAMAIVEQSMQNNYAGIFPLKNGNSNYGRPKTNTEKFYDTIQSANEFSQKLHERVGNQAEMGNGDSEPLW